MGTRLFFTKGFQQVKLKKINAMQQRVHDRWKIQEPYLTNNDVLQAATVQDLLLLQKKRADGKQKVKLDRNLHNHLVSNLKAVVDKAIATNIMDNDAISSDIRYYMHDIYTLLSAKKIP